MTAARSFARRWVVATLGVVVLYIILMGRWHPGMDAWNAGVRAASNALFRHFGDSGSAELVPLDAPGPFDTLLVVRSSASNAKGERPISLRYNAWAPAAVVLALVLATPVPRRRRARALGPALLLVILFALARIWLKIMVFFVSPTALRQYDVSEGTRFVVERVNEIVGVSFLATYAVPIMIWALVLLRPEDLSKPAAQDPQSRSRAVAQSRS